MNFSSTTGPESFHQRWKYYGQYLEIYETRGHIRKLNASFYSVFKDCSIVFEVNFVIILLVNCIKERLVSYHDVQFS